MKLDALTARARFEQNRLALATQYAVYRRRGAAPAAMATKLLRDGLVVIPAYATSEGVAKLRAAVPPIEVCRLSPEGTQTRFFEDAASLTALSPFFGNEEILDTMRTVLGRQATMLRSVVQYRTVLGLTGAFEQHFHIDSWRPRYKAFLYLTDVDEEHGPFTYTPRTHYGRWRYRFDRDVWQVFRAGSDTYIHDDQSAFVGCVWPHEYARICARQKTRPVVVTGKAGTLILFDARGLHKIRALRAQPRIILSSYWIRDGQHT